MRSGKIIGVGFQKTGTSSLAEALRQLGYRVSDGKPGLLIPILKGDMRRVLRVASRYDAMDDNPWPFIYKDLDEHLPGSKFILTFRDEESWFKSVSRHIHTLSSPIHEWIYGYGKGIPSQDKENAVRVYNRHNRDVRRYFASRPDDLLVLDFTRGDGWEELCAFLGEPVPAREFPHANNSAIPSEQRSELRKRLKRRRRRIKYFLVSQLIERLGIKATHNHGRLNRPSHR